MKFERLKRSYHARASVNPANRMSLPPEFVLANVDVLHCIDGNAEGVINCADAAGPPSPFEPATPVPATVDMIPVFASTRRTLWFSVSAMKILPAGFKHRKSAKMKLALPAHRHRWSCTRCSLCPSRQSFRLRLASDRLTSFGTARSWLPASCHLQPPVKVPLEMVAPSAEALG